ncbi:hypothetical protein J2S00_001672 [Caldalkalibacillus uzonensis]|uniref:DUF4367 domain-containing protein n=1 Tax=Caldalkalibacillus uzonensis TaxID=353224 RepID=A0ABU0CR34_9BACI|nr:hypothetical protein [Caldalkalibacillus uzonensis]MDQ0338886.1 hypothetical protein [Caldalkalibacillus uzonensis]
MYNQQKVMLVSICCLLALAGCQWFAGEPNEPAPPDENGHEPEHTPAPSPPDKQKVVTLGLEGHQEKVTLEPYVTDWIALEYDTRFEVTAEEDWLEFQHPEDKARFKVQLLHDEVFVAQQRDTVVEQGYELYHAFELENGEGYIYYLYEARDQIEIYHVIENDQAILVLMQFAEPVADKYQFVFDYMLDSITFSGQANESLQPAGPTEQSVE